MSRCCWHFTRVAAVDTDREREEAMVGDGVLRLVSSVVND
jgi:hypothetical protein